MKTNIILFKFFDFDTNTTGNRDGVTEIDGDIIVTLSGVSGLGLSQLGPTGGEAPNLISVGLNCIDTISFTVKASAIEIDDVLADSFQTKVNNNDDPDSVEYMLDVKDVSGFKFIQVFNDLHEKVLQVKSKSAEASRLKKGLYFFKDLQFSAVQKPNSMNDK
ncbi:hypothetical protein [Flavivirga eckloniae]|uniref:Uncharacterized protein n=1 Tax=Flavivirga eckloniae TaxID=1803846 RepID=A0A2K9PLW3_9FLAO|nr:hypothetical protein [Flavivirga eckloniae]AUP78040.1 hypothetical protein C1H87_04655 [Flavivirga eckloniae]